MKPIFEWNYDRTCLVDLTKMRKFNYEKRESPYGWLIIGWYSDTESVILRRLGKEEDAIKFIGEIKLQLESN